MFHINTINLFKYLVNLKKIYKKLLIIFIELFISIATFIFSSVLIYKYESIFFVTKNFTFVIIFFYLVFFFYFGLYSSYFRFISFKIFLIIFTSFIINFISILIYIYFFNFDYFDLSFIIIYSLIFYNSIIIFRYSIYKIIKLINFFQIKKNIAVYGADDLSYEFMRNSNNLNILFFINDETIENKILNRQIFTTKVFLKLKLYRKIDLIVVAKNNLNNFLLTEIFDSFKDINVPIKVYNRISDLNINISENFLSYGINNLVNRNIKFDKNKIRNKLIRKTIFISGGGGSIGSELSKQLIIFEPKMIIILENSEYNLYKIKNTLDNILENNKNYKNKSLKIHYYLCDLGDQNQLENIINLHRPKIVFHTAAYKHVNILENDSNYMSAIKNNVLNTYFLLNILNKYGCEEFIFISTDKAVKPTSLMGKTKRLGEILCNYFDLLDNKKIEKFTTVRFGNVISSAGSVIPLFINQIKNKLPVTITNPNVTRYFMTIEEAVGLIFQSTTLTKQSSKYMLKMGKSIKIDEIAKKLIKYYGFKVGNGVDDNTIKIDYVGLKKGEKLHEDLGNFKDFKITSHPDIYLLEDDITKIQNIIDEIPKLFEENNNTKFKLIRNLLDSLN